MCVLSVSSQEQQLEVPPLHRNEFPVATLHNGQDVPLVGLGCASGVRESHILSALEAGYRFLDTAQSSSWGYHEAEIGSAVQTSAAAAIADTSEIRVFVQTKIHPEDLGYGATKRAVQVSLERLQTSRLDSVLVHKPRCWEGACSKTPEGTWQDSWRALEELVDEGIIGAIGICDVDDRLLDELLQQRIRPHIIQNWMDPLNQGTDIRTRVQAEGILYQAYSSLGTQWVHHRGHATNPVLTNPTLVSIAEKYGVSVAQVIINWATRHGISVLPASTNPERQISNLNSFQFDLTDEEVRSIDALEGTAPTPSQSKERPKEVSVVFENRGQEPIDSFWINDVEEEVHLGSIEAGDELSMSSFHGHKFVFRNEGGSMTGAHVVHRDSGRNQRHVVHHGEL
ncbi:unnamed protein product [Polarella glacialis]|uniref:NADP-dependent oxidoreductase domain-containing protein n=1 Tax=Polarella glacialis TaxID=89957 RepID=A0A813KRI8_POLGL|nr:unnamed protein product [Polarella glacialis]